MRKNVFKKMLLIGMTVAMVVGGSSTALADGKAKGHQKQDNWKNSLKGKSNVNVNLNLHFNDVRGADVEWALRYIMSLTSKGVFEGFEDGSFRPRQPITRIEALKAAVSAMDLGHQALSPEEMNAKLNFKDAKQIPNWAVGYVAVALKNDLFIETEDSVQPNKPADRLWFTTLMVKALKLDDEAKKHMTAQLPFKDMKEIPAGSVGYVKVAVDRGLISGYEDNTFRPNQPVTRAEAAKLLALADEQLDEVTGDVISGTVTAAVYNQNQITITRNGQTNTYQLQPNATVPVYRNGALVTTSQLQVGDEVKLQTHVINNIRYVYYIEVTKMAEQNKAEYTVTGKYNFFGPNSEGKNTVIILQTVNGGDYPVTYMVDEGVVFKTNGHAFSYGSTVKLTIKNGLVKQIEIIAPAPSN